MAVHPGFTRINGFRENVLYSSSPQHTPFSRLPGGVSGSLHHPSSCLTPLSISTLPLTLGRTSNWKKKRKSEDSHSYFHYTLLSQIPIYISLISLAVIKSWLFWWHRADQRGFLSKITPARGDIKWFAGAHSLSKSRPDACVIVSRCLRN